MIELSFKYIMLLLRDLEIACWAQAGHCTIAAKDKQQGAALQLFSCTRT